MTAEDRRLVDDALVERVRERLFGSYGWAASTLTKQRRRAHEAIEAVLAEGTMIAPWLKEQLDAVARKMENWPEWQKRQIEAEIERTPLKAKPRRKPTVPKSVRGRVDTGGGG